MASLKKSQKNGLAKTSHQNNRICFYSQSHFSIKGSGSFLLFREKTKKAFYILVYSMTKKCYNYDER